MHTHTHTTSVHHSIRFRSTRQYIILLFRVEMLKLIENINHNL